MKFAKLSMFLFLGASIAGAATLTVDPRGNTRQYVRRYTRRRMGTRS